MNRSDPSEATCLGVASSARRLVGNNLSIPDCLECVAKDTPAAVAVAAPGRIPLTFDRLRLHVHEVRNTLNAMGVGRNDRLAVVMPDSPEAVVAFVAVAASAAFAPVNPSYRIGEFDSYLSNLRPKALITRSGVDSPAIAVARHRGIPTIELVPDVAAEAGTFTLVGDARGGATGLGFAEPADTALILTTSGTTAHPKLVHLTHANICSSALNIATSVRLSRQDRCLNVMPLYHIHGLIGAVLSTLLAGGSVVCPQGFDPAGFFAYLKEFHPSWYTAVPTIHGMVLSRAAEHADTIRRCPLRFIRSCSAPLPPEVMAELEHVFHTPVIEAYGMTEASHQICSNPLPPWPRKVRSVGIPTGCELGIIDEAGNRLPPGELGEIIIRGPNVVEGDDGTSAAKAAGRVGGWFRTGDQGSVDRDGYVFIRGRLKDVINRGGAKIAPGEVEEVLAAHPAIAQVVVFGIPHSTLGEDIVAAVVLRPHASATESTIREFAAARLADFRVPSRVLVVDHIPSGSTVKVKRSGLADAFTPLLKSLIVAHESDGVTAQSSDTRIPRLGGAGPRALSFALQLPTDRPRPTVQTYREAREAAGLPGELTEALKELSRRERVTLFMTLLAAFQTLLHRYAGSDDAEVPGDPTFRELLNRRRETMAAGDDHQDLRFETLVEEPRPERSVSWMPLVRVLFTLEEAEGTSLHLPGLAVSRAAVDTGTAKVDLAASVTAGPRGLAVAVDYNTDLYDAGTMRRLLGHYATLLGGIVTDPDARVSALPLLPVAERQHLLVTWNRTDADYPRDRCIHELIETQALQTPDAVAVLFEDSKLTYRELTHRANQLAHHLRSLGVGPEVPVGIFVERSLDMLVGLLGILKAGGGCVPLDPALPSDRLAFMLDDTGAPVLLTHQALAHKIPTSGRRLVSIDGDRPTIAQHPVEIPPAATTGPDNLAYVVYTSGSTGVPKGVAVAHRQVVNYSIAILDRLTVDNEHGRDSLAGSTFAMMKSFAVVSCFTTIYPPLIAGGCVVIVSRERSINPGSLGGYFARHPIDVLKIAPSHLAALLIGPDPEHIMPRRYLILGGEASHWEWVQRLRTLAPACTILNHFGTTETSAGVLAYQVHGSCAPRGLFTPLGRPLANSQVYILDQHLEPVPIGVAGELHIAGDCLSRGYTNRGDLTREKFIPHPFSAAPDARLYKTGDLVRYRADGNIEFLGRRDHQLKIRGFRVEPGEIEARLRQHLLVRDSAVVAREGASGGRHLIAYVTPGEPSAPTTAELREFLTPLLPDYMIPSVFIFLDALPLTPHGKVDRRALPAPGDPRRDLQTSSVAPRTSVEHALAHIWEELLGVRAVGVADSFFELGGHSLLAGQLLARVRERFQVDVSLHAFIVMPTISGLAAAIAEQMVPGPEGAPAASAGDSSIPHQSSAGPCALSFAQQRLWFLDQLEPGNAAYNIARAVRLRGALRVDALREALDALVARHEPLRTTFVLDGEEPVQYVAEQGTVALPLLDLSAVPDSAREEALERTLRTEARRPFDLTTDLMLRALLVRLGAHDHALLLTVHHIASDGWSMRILARELALLYRARTEGRRSPILPELPIRYRDFAVWQRRWLQDDALAAQLRYWKAQLAGVPPTLALPTDRPRPPAQTYRGALEVALLGCDLADALRALSRRAQVTLFMTLLGGFAALLHRYAGTEDVVLGTATAGRRRVETEALVGFFANTLPIRLDLAGDPPFGVLLHRVREAVVAAYDHQDLPFEKLVDTLRPERGLGWTPLVQVVFTIQDPARTTLDLPGLVASPLTVDTGTAKFDLTASVREGPEGISVTLEYNTDLYEPATIRRLLGHYETLLRGIAADPAQRVSQLPLLTEAERHQLLVDWNATQAPLPAACIHELFEAQVRRAPDAVAVISEDEPLTYRELNLRANRLAHHLRARGVRPDTAVGVCLAPSTDLIVTLLGILKAGGAYLPLDPAYPPERLAFMLQDAQPVAFVTRQEYLQRLPSVSVPIILLDHRLAPTISGDDPPSATTKEHLAYLMYTSGSTGQPKAVAVPHHAVTRLVQNADYVQVTAADVVAQASNASFDAATFEIWGALLNGARLIILPREVVVSPAKLSAAIEQHGVTLLFLTTALFNQMAREAPSAFQRLRALLIGGEPADPRWVQRVLDHGAPQRFLHMYGPTEATTFASWYHVVHVPAGAAGLPIGRPIANTQIYLLDRHSNPVPIGVPGEVHIGGPGVARGYVHRPQLTAEKFVSNPFDATPGGRLYKTGDLARYLPDGNIEFLGRLDRQVKIRGYRVEPGEIEAQLGQHPGVRDVAVLIRARVPDDKQLVAYVVPAQPLAPPIGELRRFLQERLPSYMIPAQFVTLEHLPLTSNGKVDRLALPAPDEAADGQPASFAAPRTMVEKIVAEMWAEVLARPRVGIHDNFFEVGGHSLLAGRLLARTRARFRVDIGLGAFFAAPTVAGLATAIVQKVVNDTL